MKFVSTIDLDALERRLEEGLPLALKAGIEHIAEVSTPLVPLLEGTLVRSQQTGVHGIEYAWISYGTPYAAYQHYKFNLRHEHGQANFLGQPLRTDGQKALEIVAERLARVL